MKRKQISDANVDVILYKSKKLANGEHPLLLRITKNGRIYRSLGISCNPGMWDEVKMEPRRNHPDKVWLMDIIAKKKEPYFNVIKQFKTEDQDYTLQQLINAVEKPITKINVFDYFEEFIKRLEISNKIGTANTVRDTYRSVKTFANNTDLTFREIDYRFCKEYETWLRSKMLKDTTLSVYFRNLRRVFNEAIKEGIAKAEDYPFSVYKISKLNTETRKRAIKKEDMLNLIKMEVPDTFYYKLSQNILKITYFAKGINFIDIAHLRWGDIQNNRVYYGRKKTGKQLQFPITEPIQSVFNEMRRSQDCSPLNYIFPILDNKKHITTKQIDNRIHKVNGTVNNHLKKMGESYGLQFPLTTYVARHSFAMAMKTAGVDVSKIRDMLGHDNVKTTQVYLAGLEDDELDSELKHLY